MESTGRRYEGIRDLFLIAVAAMLPLSACTMPPPDGNGNENGNTNTNGNANANDNVNGSVSPAETFGTSLHAARPGKRTFYEGTTQDPGFITLTNIDYDTLACSNCHAPTLADGTAVDAAIYAPSCADCHIDPANPTADVAESICLACHSRQGAVRSLAANPEFPSAEQLSDVHRDLGMTCNDCHSAEEMHGTGTSYDSLLAANAPRPACENCHATGGTAPEPPTAVAEHMMHQSNIDCAACHVQSVISCYSCHFQTELDQDFKRFYGPPPRAGFVFLVNRTDRGKVSTATFQSLTYENNAFTVIAPYIAHTVSPDARTCGDCHNNAAVASYTNDGFIDVARFADGALSGPSGVIPVPPDWTDPGVFRMDYVVYTPEDLSPTDPPFIPSNWDLLEPADELRQMLPEFSTPLTAEQMQRLSLDVGG